MQVQTSRQEFNTWLRGATLLGIENGMATIGASSTFLKEGLENRYTGPLRDLISDLVGFPVQVRVVIVPPHNMRLESRPAGPDDDPATDLSDSFTDYPGTGYGLPGAAGYSNGGSSPFSDRR